MIVTTRNTFIEVLDIEDLDNCEPRRARFNSCPAGFDIPPYVDIKPSSAPSIVSTHDDSDDIPQSPEVEITSFPDIFTVEQLRAALVSHGLLSEFAAMIELRSASREIQKSRAIIRCETYLSAMNIFHSIHGARVGGSLIRVVVKNKPRKNGKDAVPETDTFSSSLKRKGPQSTCKLFIGGLKATTTSKTLKQYFSQFGEIKDCGVVYDFNRVSRRFAYCEFLNPDAAVNVLEHHDLPHCVDGITVAVRAYCLRD